MKFLNFTIFLLHLNSTGLSFYYILNFTLHGGVLNFTLHWVLITSFNFTLINKEFYTHFAHASFISDPQAELIKWQTQLKFYSFTTLYKSSLQQFMYKSSLQQLKKKKQNNKVSFSPSPPATPPHRRGGLLLQCPHPGGVGPHRLRQSLHY